MARQIRILIVEDDSRTSELLGAMFTHAGFKVSYASNGEEALQKTHEQEFDVITLDMMMPGVKGEEVGRTISHYYKDEALIIALTAKNMTPEELLSCGATGYQRKPANFGKISQEVKRGLATKIKTAHA